MTSSTLILLVVGIVIVLVVVGIAISMSRRSRMRPLSEESKLRYAESWRQIETRFIEDPSTAVREADQLAAAVLHERGARMEDERHLPEDLVQARAATGVDANAGDTEGRRKAMLHYKRIVEDAVGDTSRRPVETQRREVA